MVNRRLIRGVLVVSGVLLGFACGSSRPGYSSENAPPALAWVTSPPQYTVSASLTLNVSATSNLGVKTVYFSVGSTRTAAAKQGDGTWLAEITLPVVGHNIVSVWAEDFTSPTPNSGESADAPYRLIADVNFAPTPPSLSYDAAFGSYTDERNIQLVTDANGIAKVPAEYTIGPKLPIPPGGDIYKASTRLSGGTMTVTELESTNKKNIPVLRFTVPHNPNIDPPLQTPTYVAHVTCSGCPDLPDASGSLLVASAADPQRALFDLPVSTETVPALAQVQGAATVSFTITAKSSAGAAATVPGFNFIFHVLGPPLAINEDAQYPPAAQAGSTYAYHLGDNTYSTMWSPSQLPSAFVRLVRYVITNPSEQPVALQLSYAQAPGGSWQAYEQWKGYNVGEMGFHGMNMNGFGRYCGDAASYVEDGFTYRIPMCVGEGTKISCWDTATQSYSSYRGFLYHKRGDTLHQFICPTVDLAGLPSRDITSVASSSDVTLLQYRVAAELGGQERTPDTDPTAQWVIVPAATGGVPGTTVVYLARAATAPRSPGLTWNLNGLAAATDSYNHYQTWDYDQWWRLSGGTTNNPGYDWYAASRIGLYLAAAQDRLYGGLNGKTQSYGEGGLYGEPTSRIGVTLSRDALYSH